jgi:hypothetical protein
MNPLNPTQILRVLENGYFMTHQEQSEAAAYIRQLQQENLTLLGKTEPVGKIPTLAEMKKLLNGEPIELAKPEQEPIGWFLKDHLETYMESYKDIEGAIPLYTASPRKPWVSLSDEEIKEVLGLNEAPWSLSGVALQHVMDDARALEAKLKEKNGG